MGLTWVDMVERVGFPIALILIVLTLSVAILRWLAKHVFPKVIDALTNYVDTTTKFQTAVAASAHKGTVQNEEQLRILRDHGAVLKQHGSVLQQHDIETRQIMLEMKAKLERGCPLFADPEIARVVRDRLTPAPGAHPVGAIPSKTDVHVAEPEEKRS